MSPKPIKPNLNLNPFSPLSPDLPDSKLDDERDGNDEVNGILGLSRQRGTTEDELRRQKEGPVIYYSRERLLKIAKRSRPTGWKAPIAMGGLETWFR